MAELLWPWAMMGCGVGYLLGAWLAERLRTRKRQPRAEVPPYLPPEDYDLPFQLDPTVLLSGSSLNAGWWSERAKLLAQQPDPSPAELQRRIDAAAWRKAANPDG